MDVSAFATSGGLGNALGAVGICFAFFFYFRGKKKKNLVFSNKEQVVIDAGIGVTRDEISVLFRNVPIERLTRSVFVFWNSGRDTIRAADIASADQVLIELPVGSQILQANIERSSRSAVGFRILTENNRFVRLAFDFLDFKDGANLSILHTAPSGSWKVRGCILGMSGEIKNWGPSTEDLEAFRTPEPEIKTWRRVARTIVVALVKYFLLLVPFFLLTGALAPASLVFLFPILGQPDTSAMLIPGQVNWFWFIFAVLGLILEYGYLVWNVLQKPPRSLTQ